MLARLSFGLLIFLAGQTRAEFANPMPYPAIPEAISSFGAAASGDYLYVFSGHMGRVPGNSTDGLSPHFCRLNLKEPGQKWEALPMHQPSQSPGLAAWKGSIYRVGGLSFKNRANEETAFHSLDTFAKFDPKTNTWKDLPALPTPRSSLDAAVVGDRLYVVGGWNLQEGGSQKAEWHEEALVFDLTNEVGKWQPIAKPPFITRALATVGHQGKLYVLGGMHNTNKITRDTQVYDPQSDSWSKGPELKAGEGFAGFAVSGVAVGNQLYYSGGEGVVYALNGAGTDWTPVERLLFPRNFHRLLPAGDNQLVAIAGVARGGGYLGNVELVRLDGERREPLKLSQWSVAFPGVARQGQALLLQGSSLYAFGGNRSSEPHDFSKEAFVDEAFRFDLASREVETLPPLPHPTQAAGACLAGNRIDQSIYVYGGLAHNGEKYSSVDTIFRYRLRSKAWMEEVGHLPATRSLFGSAKNEDAVWIFGGNRVNTTDKGLATDAWKWQPDQDEAAVAVEGAAIPTPRRSFGGATLAGKYYVVGGLGADGIVNSACVFDFQAKKWADIAAPKSARVFPNLAAAGGKLYLVGGFSQVDGHFQAATEIEVYDPKSNTWEPGLTDLPAKLRQLTVLEHQDRLLFYGIDREKAGLAHFAIVDPQPQAVSYGESAASGGGFAPAAGEERASANELLSRLMKLDKNKDGKLTKDEVGERYQPLVQRADADSDGAATRAELEALLKRDAESRRPQ